LACRDTLSITGGYNNRHPVYRRKCPSTGTGINHSAEAFNLNTTWHFRDWAETMVEADGIIITNRGPTHTGFNALRFISGYESFTSDGASRWRIAYHFPLSIGCSNRDLFSKTCAAASL
jgi:hypothetical protein